MIFRGFWTVVFLLLAAPLWADVFDEAQWSRDSRMMPPVIKDLTTMALILPGMEIQVPVGLLVLSSNAETRNNQGGPALNDGAMEYLKKQGWTEKVGEERGVWIDVNTQRFYIIEKGTVLQEMPCATATAGTGSVSGSLQTPLGWHKVAERFGANAPWGQVFRSRRATKEIWKPGDDVTEDLVLTRVLWLEGLEPGKNQGKTADGILVDSKRRYIYIHGTNGEKQIGTPSSHGCIRLLNDDVIKIFDQLPVGTPVLITEGAQRLPSTTPEAE